MAKEDVNVPLAGKKPKRQAASSEGKGQSPPQAPRKKPGRQPPQAPGKRLMDYTG